MKKKINLILLASSFAMTFALVGTTACSPSSGTSTCVTDEAKTLAEKAFAGVATTYSAWSSDGVTGDQDLTTSAKKNSTNGTKTYEYSIVYSVDTAYSANLAVSEDGKKLVVTSPDSLKGQSDVQGKIHAKVYLKDCADLAYETDIKVLVKAVAKVEKLADIYAKDAAGNKLVKNGDSVSFDAIYIGMYPEQGAIFGSGNYAILAYKTTELPEGTKVGDAFNISGTISDYSGLRELAKGSVVTKLASKPEGLADPVGISYDSTNAKALAWGDDNRAIEVKGAEVTSVETSSSGNLTVKTTLNGIEFTAFMNATYSKDVIDSWKQKREGAEKAALVKPGDTVSFTGFVSAYSNNYQVVYGKVTAWTEAPVSVTVPTNIILGNTSKVSYSIKGNAKATVTYASSDETVISITGKGVMTGKKVGKATITVTIVVGDQTYTKTYSVEVFEITVKDTTISDILAMAKSTTTGYTWDTSNIYRVEGILEGLSSSDQYGNAYLTDPATGNSVKIYGLSGVLNNGFSYSNGKYSYSNPKDAKTSLKDVKNGEKVKLVVMFEDAKGVANIAGSVESHTADTTKYASTINTPENGTASLSVTEPSVYGTEIKVTATPAEGFEVAKVTVTTAYGETTLKKGTDGTYAYNVTCKNDVNVTFKKPVASAKDTWTIKGNSTFSNADVSKTSNVDSSITAKFATNGEIAMEGKSIRTFDSGATLYLPKAAGYIYNTTAFPKRILSITLTTSANAAAGAKYAVNFGTSALSELNTSNGTAIGKNSSGTIDCEVENATYFQIATTSDANGQIVSVEITYAAE